MVLRPARAVRELLEQNGDVPFLAGMELAASARSFEDIAELDFRWPGDDEPDKIDIAALVDGRVAIGEAKRVATLGTKRESNRAIQKLIRAAPRRRGRDPPRHDSTRAVGQEGYRPDAEGSGQTQMEVRDRTQNPRDDEPAGKPAKQSAAPAVRNSYTQHPWLSPTACPYPERPPHRQHPPADSGTRLPSHTQLPATQREHRQETRNTRPATDRRIFTPATTVGRL